MPSNNPFIRRPRTEYVRLTNLSLWVPTDEQLEKSDHALMAQGRTKPEGQTHVLKPKVSLRVECEPLSYKLVGGKLGNVTLKYLDMTYGLDDEDFAAAREHGLAGIPANRFITASESRGPDEQDQPFSRWLSYLLRTGYEMYPDADGKEPTSDAIGKVFKAIEGEDSFPRSKRDNRTGRWVPDGKFTLRNLQYLVEAAPDYVQDPATVREIQVRSRDEESDEAAAVSYTHLTLPTNREV